MEIFELLIKIFVVVSGLIREHTLLFGVFVFSSLAFVLIRKFPDRAAREFHSSGLRVPKQRVGILRSELADIIAEQGRQSLRTMAQHKQRIELLKQETERRFHIIQSSPLLVKEVGEALQKVEKQYKHNFIMTQSDAAKEVLRIAAEKSIDDILKSVDNNSTNQVPKFHLIDENNSSGSHSFSLTNESLRG